jgi:hypothetical protein
MAWGMNFQEAHALFRHDIKVSALSQRVPGLDYDDVVSEMTICLWRACETYKSGTGTRFGSYWWSLWLNRRSDIAHAYYAAKRVHPVLSDEPLVEGSYVTQMAPEAPQGASDADRMVWDLLASGETATDTMELLGMSRRRYYKTVKTWQTDEVRDALTGD